MGEEGIADGVEPRHEVKIYGEANVETSESEMTTEQNSDRQEIGLHTIASVNGRAEDVGLKDKSSGVDGDLEKEDISKHRANVGDPEGLGTPKTPSEPESSAPSQGDEKSPHGDPDASMVTDNHYYPEGGTRAWLVVLGSFLSMSAGFGTINTIGIFEAYISRNQLVARSGSDISWIFGIFVFLVFFCGLQIGPIFDAKGPRLLIAMGGVCLVVSIMVLGVCTEYWHFILNFSLLGGVGASLLFTPAISAVAHWFSQKRGSATGLAAAGGSFGGVIFPLMLQKLIPQLGWGWATRIHGFLLIVLSTAGLLLLKSRLPPKKGAATTWRDMLPDFRIFNDGTGALALTAAGVFFAEWGYFIPITYIPSYSLANGVDSTFSYQVLAIQNAASCFGRWLPGYVADYIGRFNAMLLTQLLCLVSVFCFWLPANGSVPLIVIFSVLFGFASGSWISLAPICIGQLCDTQEYGRYYATVYTVVSFSSLTGVPIAGALIQACTGREIGVGGGKYWGMVVFTGLSYVASFLAFAAVRVIKRGWSLKTVW